MKTYTLYVDQTGARIPLKRIICDLVGHAPEGLCATEIIDRLYGGCEHGGPDDARNCVQQSIYWMNRDLAAVDQVIRQRSDRAQNEPYNLRRISTGNIWLLVGAPIKYFSLSAATSNPDFAIGFRCALCGRRGEAGDLCAPVIEKRANKKGGVSMITWTDKAIRTLKEQVVKGAMARDVAVMIGISRNAIIGKASRLGLRWALSDRVFLSAEEQIEQRNKQRRESRARAGVKSRGPRRSYGKRQPGASPAAAMVRAPPPVPPLMKQITFMELEAGSCRFPVGVSAVLYCGVTADDGHPYCGWHRRIATGRSQPRDPLAISQRTRVKRQEMIRLVRDSLKEGGGAHTHR